ncbi:hypothetical protein IMSAGC020_00124 [Lachnospiraceae bacterium]|nr:hypothetical protein IMSAGC020_00124 [Lachnospiraceae bacterium]
MCVRCRAPQDFMDNEIRRLWQWLTIKAIVRKAASREEAADAEERKYAYSAVRRITRLITRM